MEIALLVSAKPVLNTTGGSVYVRSGVWRVVHDLNISHVQIMHSPATANLDWKELKHGEVVIGPAYAKAVITHAGTEKYVSVYLIQVNENAS